MLVFVFLILLWQSHPVLSSGRCIKCGIYKHIISTIETHYQMPARDIISLPQEIEKLMGENTSLKARHIDGRRQISEHDLQTSQMKQEFISRREAIEQKEKELLRLLSGLKEMLQERH